MLRSKNVIVREYESIYRANIKAGRKASASDSMCHVVDDENSRTLFLGYAVAALRLKNTC